MGLRALGRMLSDSSLSFRAWPVVRIYPNIVASILFSIIPV